MPYYIRLYKTVCILNNIFIAAVLINLLLIPGITGLGYALNLTPMVLLYLFAFVFLYVRNNLIGLALCKRYQSYMSVPKLYRKSIGIHYGLHILLQLFMAAQSYTAIKQIIRLWWLAQRFEGIMPYAMIFSNLLTIFVFLTGLYYNIFTFWFIRIIRKRHIQYHRWGTQTDALAAFATGE
jgi:hypothetical protein